MVNVYEGYKVIARVRYSNNLDVWDGHNWSCGRVGHHKGITQLKDGRFVLIHGSDWQGEQDAGEIITAGQAVQEILEAGKDELLEKFGLEKIARESLIEEK